MNLNIRTATRQILATFTQLGIDTPKAIVDAQRNTERVTATLAQLRADDGQLAHVVARVIGEGGDILNHPDVDRVLTTRALVHAGITANADQLSDATVSRAFLDHADQIVDAWRAPFDAAASALSEAHAVLGSVPLDDVTTIVARGGEAADAWNMAQHAVARITTVETGWQFLSTLRNPLSPTPNRRYLTLRIADIDPATFLEDQVDGRLTPWQVQTAGYALALPTLAGYDQRVRAVEHAREHRRDAASDAWREEGKTIPQSQRAAMAKLATTR